MELFCYCFLSQLEAFVRLVKDNIDIGIYIAKPRKKYSKSHVWKYILEVYDEDDKQIDFAYYCINCNQVIYNGNVKSNTNIFLRHKCQTETVDKKKKMIIRKDTKEEFKIAAAKFVSKDIRPYYAIEGDGLFDLCNVCMKFGQSNSQATAEDLREAMPSRNTVRATVTNISVDTKHAITAILQKAKLVGGFAITSDTWTDNYKNLTYICLVAHCNTISENGIQSHRFTLYANQITELVKSKEVIVNYILSVLGDYGFEPEENS